YMPRRKQLLDGSSSGSWTESSRTPSQERKRRRRRSPSSSSSYTYTRSSRSSPSIFRRRVRRDEEKAKAEKSSPKPAAKQKKNQEEKQDKKAKVPHAVKGRSSETTKANTSDKSKNVKPEKQKDAGGLNGKKKATAVAKIKEKQVKAINGKENMTEGKEANDEKSKQKEKALKDNMSAKPKEEENGTSEKKSPKEPSPKLEPPPMVEKELEKVAEKPEKTKEERVLDKGGIHALQQSLSQDTHNLQLMLLQAKRDLDDRRDTQEKQERREKEYYRGDYGEPLGPENRLLLEEALGQGAFSTVYRCRDMKAEGEKHYAVKFIRKNSVLRSATEQEVKLMRRLRTQASELDPVGARCFLGLAGPEVIEHEGHLALCFQLQRCDLRSALKRWGQGAGLPLGLVRNYARNMFLALRALKLVSIVHSDLKPDNLLVSMDKMSVKLSDFGSAMDVKDRLRAEKASESLQPRFYRAPEVILGLPYDTQIDVWSAGCTVFEMVTGRFLFVGRDNNEMLYRIMKQLGAFSRKFCGSGKLSERHFRREDGAFRCGADASGEPLKFIGREDFPRPARPIYEELQEPLQLNGNETGQVAAKALVELILACVTPDPALRVDPEAALSTCFLRPSGNRVQ
ncbi:Serine/threonine-protein kinase PRP4 homolog (PRP4 pre-mRNA-processing factor 4 homolog), partial [Durusdinium trenchii]